VNEVIGSMFSRSAPPDVVDRFAANVAGFHPAGLRTLATAFAHADLRESLPTIAVPTLLLYGDADVRAPLDVARAIHAAIPRSMLVMLSGVGHVSTLEASERVNAEVRSFLRTVDG